jgi:surface polysaccharide O-acyltransferase-like enzyme
MVMQELMIGSGDSAVALPAAPRNITGELPISRGSHRNARLDACRIAASLAILWMHTCQSGHLEKVGEVGRVGVPFFTMAAMYLLTTSLIRRPDRSYIAYAESRFVHLYVPFLAWGLIGMAAMCLKHRFLSHQTTAPLVFSDLLNGRSFQLWYLPFLVLASLVMFPICRVAARQSRVGQYWIAAALFLIGCANAHGSGFLLHDNGAGISQYAYFFALSWDTMPSAFWGVALGLLIRDKPVPRILGWLGLALSIACALLIGFHGRSPILESAGGAGLVCFALTGSAGRFSRYLSGYAFLAYGIYLAQGVVLETIQATLARIGAPAKLPTELGVFFVTGIICVGISLALERSKWTRWMLG